MERKHIRLKDYDYSRNGAYFITICSEQKRKIFGNIVGRGLAPAENKLNVYGKIVESELLNLSNKYDNLKIDKYVIMPNHIHMILIIENQTAGASPRPTIMDVICAYKSISTKKCKENGYKEQKVFQSSFYDHVIRNQRDYQQIWKYIDDNPLKWELDKYYM